MAAVFTCPLGSICSPQAKTPVGPNKTGIFHASETKVTTQGSNGEVTGAETVVYIIKNDTFQPAAITKDGGKTYAFSDPNYPLMAGVAGADLQNDLKNPQGAIRKNVDAGVAQSVDKAGLKLVDKKTIVASTANNAPDPGTNGAVDGRNFDDDIKGSNKTRDEFPILVYPTKLAESKQDIIRFNMLKYDPKKFSTERGNLGGFGERQVRNSIGTVTLPIPNGISDTNAVTWGGETMNAVEAMLGNIALTSIKSGFAAGAGEVQKTGENLQSGSKEVQSGLAAAFTGLALGSSGGQFLSRTAGAVLNPNLELLFSAPTLRPFNFTFKLASRSPKESETIRSIIRFFKQGMSPQRSQSNLFLKAPHTFQIQYLHRNEEHKFLNKFKECALQSFNVNYTPEGQYATFTDGAMVSYQITMQFQELEPVFNDDYTSLDQNKDTEIGF
jgi:hypothetical protein